MKIKKKKRSRVQETKTDLGVFFKQFEVASRNKMKERNLDQTKTQLGREIVCLVS